jgi:general secretion pathway protein D
MIARLFWSWLGLLLGVFLVSSSAGAAPADESTFDFVSVPVAQVVTLYYREVSKRPYVVCNDLLADTRLVSVRAGGRSLDGPAFSALLRAYGYAAVDRGGVVVVCKPDPEAVKSEAVESFLYRIKYRDSAYLVDLVTPMVRGVFANRRQGMAIAVGGGDASQAGAPGDGVPKAAGGSSSAMSTSMASATGDDFVLFSGVPAEVAKLRSLLEQLDTPLGEVVVKAYMYEVGKSNSDASAVQLVMSALGGRLNISTAGDIVGNLLRLRTSSLDVVASALATDARFKVVTAPFVRLRSGKTARFVSGGQQSVLGAIVTNQNGSTQQSFERIESGTILEVSPTVRAKSVDLDLFQQVSSFVTAPGANAGQPPTLNKRELRTSLSMQDGEVVVLGGLNESKEDGSRSGLSFLPFALSKSMAGSSSELVLILEIKRL